MSAIIVRHCECVRTTVLFGKRGRGVTEKIVIKPHHFMDIIKLYGAGITCFIKDENYQHDFYKIGNMILEDHNLPLKVTIHGDDICKPCIHYSGDTDSVCKDSISHIENISLKDSWNKILDKRIIDSANLDTNKIYTAEEFCEILYDMRDSIFDIWKEDNPVKTKERFDLFCTGARKYLK